MNNTQWTPEVRAMWVKLEGFRFDKEDAVFDFTTRLARENGWSRAYAVRVIQEYKRFLLLAMHAGHPVTPSDEVDQAWHLHLVYTRSYWEGLCRDTLGRPLHHGPTQGGEAEGEKFADWYEKTRCRYRQLFGSEPPPDIWPPRGERFDRNVRFERVNRSRYWLLPKIGLRKAAMAAGIAGAAVALAACGKDSFARDDVFIILCCLMVVVAVGVFAWKSYRHTSKRGGCGSHGCGTGAGMTGCGSRHSDGESRHSGFDNHGGDSGCGTSSGCGSSGCGGGGCGGD